MSDPRAHPDYFRACQHWRATLGPGAPEELVRKKADRHIAWREQQHLEGAPIPSAEHAAPEKIEDARNREIHSAALSLRKLEQVQVPEIGKEIAVSHLQAMTEAAAGRTQMGQLFQHLEAVLAVESVRTLERERRLDESYQQARAELTAWKAELSRKLVVGLKVAAIWAAAVFLVLVFILAFSVKAHAQFSHINNITLENNDGSTAAFFASPFTLKLGANCTWVVVNLTATANCTGGSGSTEIQVNGVDTTSQTPINFQSGTNLTVSNPSVGNVKFDFSGQLAQTIANVSHKWLNSYTAATGLFTQTQPACGDLSDAGTLCASSAALPANTTATAHNFFTAYNSTTGAFTKAQPACADISDAGTLCTSSASPVTNTGTLTLNKVIIGNGTSDVKASAVDYNATWFTFAPPYYLFSTTTNHTSNPPAGNFLLDVETSDGLLHCWTDAGASCLPAAGAGTVTSIATTSPITGGTITTTGTIACATCVTYTTPATGLARSASGSQAIAGSELSGAVLTSGSNVTTPGKSDVMQTSLYCQDAGASDTYACNLSPAVTAYVTGTHYVFKANTANTGAASINFNAVGALTLKKLQGAITTDLADNDIRAGQWVECIYDGTNCQMESQLGNSPSASITGADTQVLFFSGANNPAGDAGMTYNAATDALTVAGSYNVSAAGGGFLDLTEGTAPTCATSHDVAYADSTAHRLKVCDNNGTAAQLVNSGADINTSDQVTITHLAAALPVNQGGTGTVSTLTGFVRGSGSAMTATEISGDGSTSGSGVLTLTHTYPVALGTTGNLTCTNGGGTTQYIGVTSNSTTETTGTITKFIPTEAYVISRMYASAAVNVPASQTVALTVMDSADAKSAGAAQTVTCSAGAGVSACNDTSHSFTTTAGHAIYIKAVCSGGTSAATGPWNITLGLK